MPSVEFSSTLKYGYRKGRIYQGVSPLWRRTIGIKTDRHAITIAGAGAGKGACIIIPNILRWRDNLLSIDPKGEAVTATYKARLAMGQLVYAVDPFEIADIPDKYRASFNPFVDLDPTSPTIREEINVLSDSMVKRSDPRHALWDDSAQTIISGIIAFVLIEEEQPTLSLVREVLRGDNVHAAAEIMATNGDCAGLMQAAASTITGDKGDEYLQGARRHTEWLDTPAMAKSFSKSSFSLSELKHGKASVYLVLPADMINEHSRFLRVFVRCAIAAMQRIGKRKNIRDRQCLFFLDEFYTLGKMVEIQKSAGLMRGYGLQLWPILQDLGQLVELYGREGAETFFGNSDIQQFFGNTDQTTLEFISKLIGTRHAPTVFGNEEEFVGKPLMSPQEVRKHVAKKQNAKVARRMLVFSQGGDVLSVRLRPYFQ